MRDKKCLQPSSSEDAYIYPIVALRSPGRHDEPTLRMFRFGQSDPCNFPFVFDVLD